MKYIITYYRTQGVGSPSLVLQQYLFREIPVCFVCVCSAENEQKRESANEFVKNLSDWSDNIDWTGLVKSADRSPFAVRDALADVIEAANTNSLGAWLVMLCIGQSFFLFGENMYVYWLTTSYGKGKLEKINAPCFGQMEAGAGIFLSSENLNPEKRMELAAVSLQPEKLREEKIAGRRLKEFGQRAFDEKDPVTLLLLMLREGAL